MVERERLDQGCTWRQLKRSLILQGRQLALAALERVRATAYLLRYQGRAWTAQEPCVSHDHGRCDIAASGAHGASQRLMTSQVIAGTPLGTHTQRRQSVQA